jgi:GTP cyclohydrolase I
LKTLILSGRNLPLTEKEKQKVIDKASKTFGKYLTELGLDWRNDPNMIDSPKRITKAYVNEFFQGMYASDPHITAFNNVDKYDGMVFSGDIKINSICSHHFAPIFGKAHIAYIPSPTGKIIGLSKLNRVVEYFARRPQVQENLTMMVHKYLDETIEKNTGVAVLIEANHYCTCGRGVRQDSVMKTSKLSGSFLSKPEVREEFYHFLNKL